MVTSQYELELPLLLAALERYIAVRGDVRPSPPQGRGPPRTEASAIMMVSSVYQRR
ncbi:MAG TPA: hypothetical protein VMG12_05170 [Polyangiaceae bacterium]|nr:hypothetical protein [Polyangiaceae bacterium]